MQCLLATFNRATAVSFRMRPDYHSQIIPPFSAMSDRQLIHCGSVDKESTYFLRFIKPQLCYWDKELKPPGII